MDLGADGLRFELAELRAHLAFLKKEFSAHPSRKLRLAVRAERVERHKLDVYQPEGGSRMPVPGGPLPGGRR